MKTILFLVFVAGCSFVSSTPTSLACQKDVELAKKTASSISGISVKIYKELVKENKDKNLIYSPISIALALSLLERGSGGETRADLNRFLGLDEATSAKAYEALQNQPPSLRQGDKVKLQIANAVFADERFTLISEYQNAIKQCFASEIKPVQFRASSETARQTINSWVSQKTNAKIPELFKSGSISGDTAIVLANAVYFKAAWADQDFHNVTLPFYKNGKDDQKQESIKYFTDVRYVGYAADDQVQVIEMPYQGEDLAMYIVLPKQRDGLAQVEQALTAQKLSELLGKKNANEYKRVALKLPKFGARTAASLNDILKKMGLEKLFTKVDLSRMVTSSENFFISQVVHEAFIKVDETGTEAAAATGIAASGLSANIGTPEPPIPFVADHPFLYGIAHKPTGVILFMGKTVLIETVE